jgi:hypothetical protein
MRKLAMILFVATVLAFGVSSAYAEPVDFFFDDDFGPVFLNPQPLPP